MTLSLTTAFNQGLTKMFVFLKTCMLILLPIASIQETEEILDTFTSAK